MRNKMFPLLILMGSKKVLNKIWNCICCGKVIAIWNIFGAPCPRYITGLTMGTYLNWAAAEKVRQNRQRDFFSVSHREIPHWAGHKIWYPRAHSAFAKKKTHFGVIWFMIIGMIMQIKIWSNKWNLISAHCTLPISRSQEGNKTYSDESGERLYFAASHILAFLEKN